MVCATRCSWRWRRVPPDRVSGDSPAQHWADTWQRAWAASDVESIVVLYSDKVVFSSEPFREPYVGRDGVRTYVTQAFGGEEEAAPYFGRPVEDADRAAVPWWTSLREDGRDATLAGISLLRFDDGGLVVQQWDAWNVLDERRDPPEEFGPFARRTA